MAITRIDTDVIGTVGVLPTFIFLETDNTLAEVLVPGYVNSEEPTLVPRLNEYQCALLYTTDYKAVTLQISINPQNRQVTFLFQGGGGGGSVNSVLGTAGQIVSSGGANPAIGLANVTGVAGNYTNANITVDAYGRVTVASNGSGGGGSGTVTSVTGTSNRIAVNNTDPDNPVVDISAAYVGQTSITTLGTIGTGVWQGTIVSPTYGGTGVNNASRTITLGGSLTTSGAFTTQFTMTGNTNVVFPTTGTLATTAGTVASITGTAGRIAITGTSTNPIIDLVATAVVPNTYTYTQITVDAYGRITSASSGVAPVTSVTGTANQINVSGGTTPTVSLPNAIIVPGTLTLNANPTQALEAATKQYVDATVSGLTFKGACLVATTTNLVATYDNGVSGVGATLTNADTQAAFSTDGETPTVSSRVLVKNQSSAEENGIYVLTDAGSGATDWVLTRATDYDQPSEIIPGDFLVVQTGTLYANTSWIQTETVAAVGTDPIDWVQFGASTTGVTSVSGTTDRIDVTSPTTTPVVDIAATYVGQSSITTLGTIGTGVWQGTIVSPTYGGTGVNNGANTLTLGGSLTTVGAFAATFNFSGVTNVTFPTSGTLSTSSGTVTSVSGTSNQIDVVNGTTTPVISISATYAGQSSIVTVGTIGTGTWNGTVIESAYGGTGVNNGSSTITLGGSLTTTGAFTANFTMTANTSVTFPTSGTLLTSSALANYALLNATNDFNFNIQQEQQIRNYSETVSVLGNITTTQALNLANGNVFTATATGNVALSVTNVPASGQCASFTLIATNFGAFTITWPSGTTWTNGSAPTFKSSGVDTIVFYTIDGGTSWSGTLVAGSSGGGGGGGGTVTSVTGTTDRIDVTSPTTTPVVDIAATYVGQSSITTLGTVTTGTWNGTAIGSAYGGTGVNNGSSTITLGGSFTTSGAFTTTLTVTGNTNVTLPTTGTLITSSALANYAVLNATNTFAFNTQSQMHLLDYSEAVSALGNISTTATINLSNGNVFTATATGNVAISTSNVPTTGTCASITLIATNFGAYTITWPTTTIWPGGVVPTLTTSGVDVLTFFTINGGTTWYGMVAGQGFA